MAVAELVVNIVAGTAQFTQGMKTVSSSLQKTGQSIQNAGSRLTRVTAPLAAFGALSIKSAIDFESAFAGVRKTVDATEPEFARLSQGIRNMSKEVPIVATEIAAITEAAGQLGIKNEALLGFTRVMADLGTATNMSSEEAANALARLANITQMPQDQFDRLGSVVVDLGNKLAATESEIVEMGLRIAGAGAQVGMSEAQILGFAGALANVGVNAEAGGTAISKVFKKMSVDVETGSGNIENFARIAGLSVEQFSKMFSEDAAGAVTLFVEGLGKTHSPILELTKLGQGWQEIRLQDSLLRLAGAGDTLRNSLEIGVGAWRENNALSKEAAERYKTTASQVILAKNAFIDAATVVGEILLPVVRVAATAVKSLSDWFVQLDPGTQKAIVAFGAIVTAAGPMLFAIGSVIKIVGVLIGASALGGVVIAVGLVIAAYVKWQKQIDAFIDQALVPLLKEIKEVAVGITVEIMKMVQETIEDFGKLGKYIYDFGVKAVADIGRMVSEIKDWLGNKLNAAMEAALAPIKKVEEAFAWLRDKVTGNSHIPDMVTEIGGEINKLDAVMVKPTQDAVAKVETEFSGLATSVGTELDAAQSKMDDWATGLDALGNIAADAIGGKAGQAFKDLTGAILGAYNAYQDYQSAQGRPDGVQGPVMADGSWGGQSADGGAGYYGAISQGIISATGAVIGEQDGPNDKRQVGAESGMAAGAAIGTIFGPIGTVVGAAIGAVVGGVAGELLSGTRDAATLARREFEAEFEKVLQMKNVTYFDQDGVMRQLDDIIMLSKDHWNAADWPAQFQEMAGSATTAFDGVGKALGLLFDMGRDTWQHLGAILAANLNGNIENLGELLVGLDIPIEDFEAKLLEALENGEIGIREYLVAMQGVHEAFEVAEAAAGDVDKAIQRLVVTGGDSMKSVQAIKGLAQAAKAEGITAIDALVQRMISGGQITEEKAAAFMSAMAAHGISSVDQLENASTGMLASILGHMTSIAADGGANFFEFAESADKALKVVEDSSEKVADNVKKAFENLDIEVDVKLNIPDIPESVEATQSAKGNVFQGGAIRRFAKGGVFNQKTFFNIGSMAEQGPEAIMPLERLPDGRLGVLAQASFGGGGETNHFHIDARGAEIGFAKRIRREIEGYLDRRNREPGRRV